MCWFNVPLSSLYLPIMNVNVFCFFLAFIGGFGTATFINFENKTGVDIEHCPKVTMLQIMNTIVLF